MRHREPLISARLVTRENRFLAQVTLDPVSDSEKDTTDIDVRQTHPPVDRTVPVHVPNSGRLGEILIPGRHVYLRKETNPGRKTAYTLVLVRMESTLVSIESVAANRMAEEFFTAERFEPFREYDVIEAERRFGSSRFDFFLSKSGRRGGSSAEAPGLFVEIKGVTLVSDGLAKFPDAPTTRGTRHLLELIDAVGEGYRAAVLFVAQRGDVGRFTPNDRMDPDFGRALRKAQMHGVEVYAVSSRVTIEEKEIIGQVPVLLE